MLLIKAAGHIDAPLKLNHLPGPHPTVQCSLNGTWCGKFILIKLLHSFHGEIRERIERSQD